MTNKKLKVALVHYWLVGMRGGEKVLEVFAEMYPDADIYTLVVDRSKISPTLASHKITASFLQNMGGVKHYKKMLPLMPFALESFDLTGYDLVISSEAGPAKGVVTGPNSVHICYCHSPMRYIWDLFPQYQKDSGWLTRTMMNVFGPLLRQWDVTTAARVDHFIANSAYVAKRIRKFYRRESTVIHPPVDLSRFAPVAAPGDYYLCAGQVTPYKRLDIAVEAFNQSGKRLVVIGSGVPAGLRAASKSNIEYLGTVDDETMARHFASCKALIYPGVEDFGIVPLEVMASGRPVIAYAEGGALETVIRNRTGVFFDVQSSKSLLDAIESFEANIGEYNLFNITAQAGKFSRDVFKEKIERYVDAKLQNR
jgi:glycosyltransferase involved in cell wall biosynthesis